MSEGSDDAVTPIYRFGDPATAAEGEVVTRYDEADMVPATTYGMNIRSDGRHGPLEMTERTRELVVRLEQVWGYQDAVAKTHVENLASVPPDAFTGDHAPEAIEWPDGTYQVIGHHRVCAAYLRGVQTIRVRVKKRVTRFS